MGIDRALVRYSKAWDFQYGYNQSGADMKTDLNYIIFTFICIFFIGSCAPANNSAEDPLLPESSAALGLPWFYLGDATCLIQGGQYKTEMDTSATISLELIQGLNDESIGDFFEIISTPSDLPDRASNQKLFSEHLYNAAKRSEDHRDRLKDVNSSSEERKWERAELRLRNLVFAVKTFPGFIDKQIIVTRDSIIFPWPFPLLGESQSETIKFFNKRVNENVTSWPKHLNISSRQTRLQVNDMLGPVDSMLDYIMRSGIGSDAQKANSLRTELMKCDAMSATRNEHECILELVTHYLGAINDPARLPMYSGLPVNVSQTIEYDFNAEAKGILETELFFPQDLTGRFRLFFGINPVDLELGKPPLTNRLPCGNIISLIN